MKFVGKVACVMTAIYIAIHDLGNGQKLGSGAVYKVLFFYFGCKKNQNRIISMILNI